jgi:uncharacterized protein YggE
MENLTKEKSNLMKAGAMLLIIVSVYFIIRVLAEFRSLGGGSKDANIITVSGHGEVKAVPDIANIYFTISKDAKTVKEAQEAVAKIEKASLDFLKGAGVAEKDIKAENASFYPKYEYKYNAKSYMLCNEYGCPPNEGRNVIVGYTASESVTVKIRNTDEAGTIMQGLGALGVSSLNGPNFSIDDEDALKALARKEAIDEARAKAKVLAKDLGVRLGKVTSFNEGGYYPTPMMYGKVANMGADMAESAPAQLPRGENTISSDVTITFEIR